MRTPDQLTVIDRQLPDSYWSWPRHQDSIERAVLYTMAYADVFDHPLSADEIHRFLIGFIFPKYIIDTTLAKLNRSLVCEDHGLYTLPGREHLTSIRKRREERAASLWPKAIYYGQWMARLPYVRMVAVTGALAMDNIGDIMDIDFLIVSQSGRLWTCRAFIILLVRWASLRGDWVCPNYFLSKRFLQFTEQNLYTAHELIQMVPIHGLDVYFDILRMNQWVYDYLPNAIDYISPRIYPDNNPLLRKSQLLMEYLFNLPAGERFESWEMNRKIKRFESIQTEDGEASFSADCCKGHFYGHGNHVMKAYLNRISKIEETLLSR